MGQKLANLVKPRLSLFPMVFGLGIEVGKVFRSKWLLAELYRLEFSISPDEAARYQQSVVCNESGYSCFQYTRKTCLSLASIPRQKRRTVKEVVKKEEIPVIEYDQSEKTGLSAVTLKPIVQLHAAKVLPSGLFFVYL